MDALHFSQELVRESIMRIYHMDAATADKYFRNLWLVAFSFATLIVTDDCPYTDAQMSAVFTDKVYQREPKESYQLIFEHLRKKLPQASEEQIRKLLK